MNLFLYPEEVFYTPNHHWVNVDENLLTIGLTAPMASSLGEILYLDLPDQGLRINRGHVFGTAESLLKVFDLIAPASGLIVEINSTIIDEPFIVNDDPFGEGWILKIEMEDEKNMHNFIRSAEYQSQFVNQCFAINTFSLGSILSS